MSAGVPRFAKERWSTLRKDLARLGCEEAIFFAPESVYYLTGFNPIIQSSPSCVWFSREREEPVLVVASLRRKHAQEEAWVDHVESYGRWGSVASSASSPLEALQRVVSPSVSSFGLELERLPVGMYERIRKAWPRVQVLDVGHVIDKMRAVKDAQELDYIRKAALLADKGMEAAIAAVRERRTEAEIATAAMGAMHRFWAEMFPDVEPVGFGHEGGGTLNALWAYCLSGPRMDHMCDAPTSRRPQDGELVLIVIWASLAGYHAENERTVAVGDLSKERERLYAVTLEARRAAFAALRPGTPARGVYEAAAQVFRSGGFGDILPGRVGHGIGLSPHEPFSLAPTNTELLRPGQVLTIEPALRVPGVGGVQHSDTVVITEEGYEVLTRTPSGFLKV